MPQGYIRFPHIYRDQIVFVAEDDLWLISDQGGRAERLTAAVDEIHYPRFSPDGQWLAFVGEEEGPTEVYVMPASGGPATRLTFQSAACRVLGWTADSKEIVYASNAGQYTWQFDVLYAIALEGGMPRQLPFGMANAIAYGPRGEIVLGRNIDEPAHWKRYRGGRVGHLWYDVEGNGTFRRLLRHIDGNLADPCWIGERIYFLSDHEGIGNIYSCTSHGEDVRRHTNHDDFYARNLAGDGQRLVYHAGADLYLFDPASDEARRLDVELPSLRTQRNRKFVSAAGYLDTCALHPQGYAVAVTTRGKAFSMGNWEGPVLQHGEPDGARYRYLEWLSDGKRFVAVSDEIGREALVLFDPETAAEPRVLRALEFGRVTSFEVSPMDDFVALANHRNQLVVVSLEREQMALADTSDYGRIDDLAWSPDGNWLAYSFDTGSHTSAIKLLDMRSGETYFVTEPVMWDFSPSFDPEGKYLYFLSNRIFNPVRDMMQEEWSFPRSARPYLITLRNDLRSPFMPEPKAPPNREKDKENNNPKKPRENDEAPREKADGSEAEDQPGAKDGSAEDGDQDTAPEEETSLVIDLDGITKRALPFPVAEGRYHQIRGIRGKALYLSFPIEGTLHITDTDTHEPKGTLFSYDFETLKQEWIADGVSNFELSRDTRMLLYRSSYRLRVLKAGEKAPKTESTEANRDTGWLDLGRIKVSVQPAAEWRQMFAEAWRLQSELFWTEDMSGVDWQAMYDQYAPLVERVGSRSELSDLFHELQGELGTSHAYEWGGQYRSAPHYQQGFLGVDWAYDGEANRYRIAHIVQGDSWNASATSPLTIPGVDVAEGDAVLAISGQRVGPNRGPQELLVNQARNEVQLTIEDAETKETRVVTVKALGGEWSARYREWVERNRQIVHEKSDGKVGYIHVPNMGPVGFAEFHRGYLAEFDYPALLVDVRWNTGGNISGLLLEKLARRRVGYAYARWRQKVPYPRESPRGPMVALTNEYAASDGDIFSHSFKLLELGPLIGLRTWGGVVGLSASPNLVDGTHTTQPTRAYWFKDVEWGVENHGTDPDIEVDIAPQDYVQGFDPQLDRAITEALRRIEEQPALESNPEERPHRGRKFLT